MFIKKIEVFFEKHKSVVTSMRVLSGILFLILTAIITNQLVSPLFSPRVANIDIEPLVIRSLETDYYLISKLSYEIEAPIVPPWIPLIESNKLDLEFPCSRYGIDHTGRNAIKLINFKEVWPHIKVELFENNFDSMTVDKIPVTITTDAWSNKRITQTFYMRQLVDIDSFFSGDLGYATYRWWHNSEVSPLLNCGVASSKPTKIATLQITPNRTASLLYQVFKNTCNLDIEGFRPLAQDTHRAICDEEKRLDVNDNHISFNIEAGEEKTIYLIEREENNKKPSLGMPVISYNYTTDSCFWLWKTVREIGCY